ncbi:MAG TPA: 4-hydroxy-tetrahydrodipicolinate synthase [Acidimicrobiales bacterium]|jgi:4-hydroxy-tetrahydrodipicolinate synthase|nr:4-hydroxy-tetrahydrodipicolinate synthase [Acidimicrobiales bacterium]
MPTIGRFGAVGCAMVTPFDGEGRLDVDGAVALARWLCSHGNDFLVLAGTTGESPVLTNDEKAELWRSVVESVTVPVVAGTSDADTQHSVELTHLARQCGAAGILAVTPYYNRPGPSGIEAHFRAIHGAADGLPVLLYDIPVRTGRKISNDVMVRLARDEVIVGVKDATANPAGSAALMAEVPDGFELYSGNDGDTLPLLAVGAVGVISVESHWAGDQVAEMVAAFQKGDVDHARELNARLVPSHQFQSTDATPNPIPAKAMMRVLGHEVGECRLPMGPAPEGLEAEARRVYDQLSG